jgi:peptidoglycan/LPS O-acetylase OafA/YrhL
MALTAISAATVIWRTGVLPRWLAPLGAASGLLHIVGAFVAANDSEGPLFFMRFAGLIAFGVFVAAASVTLVGGTSISQSPQRETLKAVPR